MKKYKNRQEVPNEYKWDLTSIFKNTDEWNIEYKRLESTIADIEKYRGKICESADMLYEFLEYSDALERALYKLYYYAHLNFDADTRDTQNQELQGKINDLLVKYETLSSFVAPEMHLQKYEKIKEYIKENNKLEKYSHNLENFYRYENHKLNEDESRVISMLLNALSSPEEIYSSLTDSDLKFDKIENSKGEKIDFSESLWGVYSRSEDRTIRKNAFQRLYNTYANYKNTIANTFSKNVDYHVNMAKLKKFTSSLEKSLYSDAISPEVYNNLIKTVNDNLDGIYEYFKLKKDVLKLDELHLYDAYARLTSEDSDEYSFEDAKKIVLEALSVLGEDYTKKINRAFDEKWIDVCAYEGKRSGAYSSGFYDTNPYILLNYEGTFEDVSTLAHELGHSMHTLYSCENNPYNNSSYQIFVAEVASTVNELILRNYLLKKTKDPKVKLSILNSLLELFKSTIYRQVMFAEFERDMHAAKENGTVLTNEYLSDEYYKLNQKYFGSDVVVDEEIKYEWMRIPHFYYDFYVYKYAIGLSSACFIVENILNNKPGALENYKKFLSSGGSMYPAEELLLAGVDITTSEVIESAINMFKGYIQEFRKIYNELEKEVK